MSVAHSLGAFRLGAIFACARICTELQDVARHVRIRPSQQFPPLHGSQSAFNLARTTTRSPKVEQPRSVQLTVRPDIVKLACSLQCDIGAMMVRLSVLMAGVIVPDEKAIWNGKHSWCVLPHATDSGSLGRLCALSTGLQHCWYVHSGRSPHILNWDSHNDAARLYRND
jgi:hypothetical protein